MKRILEVSLLVFAVYASGSPVNNGVSKDLLWDLHDYRPPHFSLPIYKALVLDNMSTESTNEPIILKNFHEGMFVVITSDNYKDYEIIEVRTNATNETQIQLQLTSTEPLSREFDVIFLEALDEELISVAKTTIMVFNANKEFDMFKMKFKIDDSEYIVLNYFYFKWFLALLTVTGLLILIIELHEIIKNIKIARNNATYRELQNM